MRASGNCVRIWRIALTPSSSRHGQVDERDIGTHFAETFHRFAAVLGERHHGHVGLKGQDHSKAIPHDRMVVHDQDANGIIHADT